MQILEPIRRSVYALLTLVILAAPASADVLLNAGGGATGAYAADQYFTGGSAYTFGTQSGVYNTERWSATGFSYAIPVTPGQVEVTLRFRESCRQCTTTRSFRVEAEGQVVLASHAVPVNTIGDRTFIVNSDSTLNLVFTRLTGEAWVNAIEVRSIGGSTPPPPQPPQVTLSASPTSVSVGNASTLTWSSVGASTCTASGAWTGSRATSGSVSSGALSTTSTFALSCTGSGGTTSSSATVNVVTNPPPSVTLSVAPSTVMSGGAATLTWSSSNATTCTASGGWSGARATSGSVSTGALTATTMFSLTCTGSGGSNTQRAAVTVAPMPTVQFTANPTTVANGASATLSWTSTNATSCVAANAWSGTKATSGSQSTGPLSTTGTYELTCSGTGGSVTGFATVTVTASPAPSVTITATPSSVASGSTSSLSWASSNATACTASGGWTGSRPTSGSYTTSSITGPTTFTVTCTGAGGTASSSATVGVLTSFTPVLINAGGGAISGYVADSYFTGGSAYTFGNQTGVYNSERWSATGFSYAIPVAPGQVEVILRFRESCTSCGTRSFRVEAEGQVLLANHVVPANTVADRTFIVNSDATLNLVFTRVAGEAWVNGIEVRPVGSGGPSPPQLSLSASPTSVSIGNASTLTWSSTGASSCTASGAWTGAKATSGSWNTGPLSASSTFGLSCTGSGGTATGSATVTVAANPLPTITLTATPATVTTGAAAMLNWSSTNATSCTASGGWSGAKAVTGSASTGALTAATTFALACSGAGGTASASATVSVTGASSSIFPLHVESGKRYLVDANGAPFLIHGDTPWSLIVQLSRADVDLYLENRRQKGFNTILVNLIEHYFATNPPKNFYGESPFFTAGDFATPNDAYFAHAEYVISKAAEKGILVMLTPAYMGSGGGNQGWYQEMVANGTTKLRAYGQYIATRFLAHDNILWVEGGDMNPPNASLMRAIADGIRDIDGRWLQTFHGSRNTSALGFLGTSQPWLQVNTIYTDQTNVVAHAFQEYARSTMPFFLIEAIYESGSGLLVRQQAYQTVLSGGSGQFMGHSYVWAMLDNNWRWAIDSEGAQTLTHLRTLLESWSWWNLQPDVSNSLLTNGIGTAANRAVAAFAADRAHALIYTPSVRTLTVELGQLAGPNVNARWYDPTTGAYVAISGSPFVAGGPRTFTPPGNNARGSGDWVLVLQSTP